MAILVNNLQDVLAIKEEWLGLLEEVLQKGLDEHRKSGAEVSVILVNDDYIKELNSQYRGMEQSTDVLSFALTEESAFGAVLLPEGAPELLGDIYISIEHAADQAKEYGHSFTRELCYLASHGLLHLLGFDHQSPEETAKMREAEEKILNQFSLGRSQD